MAKDIDALGYVSDETNKRLLYLVAVSRKLADPLSTIVLSQSGAGKSTSTSWRTSYPRSGRREFREGLPDKTGIEFAVVTRSSSTGLYRVEYDGRITTFVPPTFIFQGGGQLDFDAAGNLLVLTGSDRAGPSGLPARLYRISAAQLAAGGAAQLELVADGIQLTTTPGCATPCLAVSCDGHAYVALTNVYYVGACENVPRPSSEIHKVDLDTRAIVADIPALGERFGLAVSCRSGELFGLERVLQSPVIIWRSVDDGPPQPLSPAPTGYLYGKRVAMDPSGRLIVEEQWYGQSYGPHPVVTPYQVAPCTDCCPPGSPTPSPQPSATPRCRS